MFNVQEHKHLAQVFSSNTDIETLNFGMLNKVASKKYLYRQ